jgi:hypothetical protein
VYLVGFSYAFFWVGMAGLTITIGAILTLAVLMQVTGRLDWGKVFASHKPAPPVQGTEGHWGEPATAVVQGDNPE